MNVSRLCAASVIARDRATAGSLCAPDPTAMQPAVSSSHRGNNLPPLAFDVLHRGTLVPLGLAGLGIALVGALRPARRAARSRVAETLRSE